MTTDVHEKGIRIKPLQICEHGDVEFDHLKVKKDISIQKLRIYFLQMSESSIVKKNFVRDLQKVTQILPGEDQS